MKDIKVGVLGAGVVGSGTLDLLERQGERIAGSIGARFVVKTVVVRDPSKPRGVPIDPSLLSTDAERVLNDPEIDVVVELIGGETPATAYIERAMRNGKHVVTANKEVIAKHGAELLDLAAKCDVNLFFEASVGGGIPVISVMKHDLIGNEMNRIRAIINGTTNFILTAMEQGRDYDEALREAQRLGYAEADPRNDVEGIDAAYKLSILSTLGFRSNVRPEQVYRVGISKLRATDFRHAARMGYVIKLLAAADVGPSGIEVSVRPTMIPLAHHLANVKGVYNAVLIDGEEIDEFMLYGRGAGARPTASAVVADLVCIAHNMRRGTIDRINWVHRDRPVADFGQTVSRYYLRIQVADQPGVLARISSVLGNREISIASMLQAETDEATRVAELVFMTHAAKERHMAQALTEIEGLDVVREIAAFLRVER